MDKKTIRKLGVNFLFGAVFGIVGSISWVFIFVIMAILVVIFYIIIMQGKDFSEFAQDKKGNFSRTVAIARILTVIAGLIVGEKIIILLS